MGIGGHISTKNSQEKKYDLWNKPFQKDIFGYDLEIGTYVFCERNIILKKTYAKNVLLDK